MFDDRKATRAYKMIVRSLRERSVRGCFSFSSPLSLVRAFRSDPCITTRIAYFSTQCTSDSQPAIAIQSCMHAPRHQRHRSNPDTHTPPSTIQSRIDVSMYGDVGRIAILSEVTVRSHSEVYYCRSRLSSSDMQCQLCHACPMPLIFCAFGTDMHALEHDAIDHEFNDAAVYDGWAQWAE